jgi:hypothetical protein
MREGIRGFSPSAPDDHIARVEKEVDCMRIRPEEVAAAGLFDDFPVAFEELERAGAWILDQIPAVV